MNVKERSQVRAMVPRRPNLDIRFTVRNILSLGILVLVVAYSGVIFLRPSQQRATPNVIDDLAPPVGFSREAPAGTTSESPADTSVPTLEDKHSLAEFVLLVQIESGSVERTEQGLCGGRYVAEVLERVKGPTTVGDRIDMLANPGLVLGGRYLVFLTDYRDDPAERLFFRGGPPLPDGCLARVPSIRMTSAPSDIVGTVRTIGYAGTSSTLEFVGLWYFPSTLDVQSSRVDVDIRPLGSIDTVPLVVFRANADDVLSYLRSR